MKDADYILIGSGMNSLVCAAMLARRGSKVLVLEREATAGGCIKTGEVTLPGFRHDLMSGFYPEFLASPAYAELGEELGRYGLKFLNTSLPTASLLAGGKHFIFRTDRAANIAEMNRLAPGDGDRLDRELNAFAQSAELTFGILGNEPRSLAMLRLMARAWWRIGATGMIDMVGRMLSSATAWLDSYGEEARACFLPWILHAGMDPDGPFSGHMAKLFAFALEGVGMPVVEGASENIVKAFTIMIENHGGQVLCGEDVEKIVIEAGKAKAVITTTGSGYSARKAVICNVTPQALYGRLLAEAPIDDALREQARDYRYGRANMIIHLALDRLPDWPNPELANVAMIHIMDSAEQMTLSLAEAKAGLLPRRATLAVGQKAAVDTSRVPEGKFCLWIQLHEVPRVLKGDACGKIATGEGWSESVREAYADRIVDQLVEFAPNLRSSILGRNVFSPTDLERMNCNLVGGDPYSGANALDQFLLWRPLRGAKNHQTPIRNVYHIGASTHPGPGLGGGSGFQLGKSIP